VILVDTCAILWIEAGERLKGRAAEQFAAALLRNNALVSPVSAWEIGKLASLNRLASPVPPQELYRRFVSATGLGEAPLTAEILIASSFLPGAFHRDPMDRILIATARESGATILTRDRAILAYGAAGHVRTLAC
jgi:PIN domain nuclease of toxin-antitoxin system